MLDVHPNLSSLISTLHNFDSLESIDSNVKSIHLPDRICNDEEYTIFNLSRFILLEELERQMKEAAKVLDFERAMELRDMIEEIKDGK